MANCYACKEETGGDLYCPYCGTLQKCLNCNHVFETEGKFCGECGTEKGKKPTDVPAEKTLEEKEVHKEQPVVAQQKAVNTSNIPLQSQSSQPGNQPTKKPLNIKMIVSAVVVIAVAAIIYFVFFNNPQKTPEDTVTLFVEAMNEKDAKKFEKLVRPSDREEIMEDVDFSELPKDAEIELLGFGEEDKESDSIVNLEAKIHFSSAYLGESDSEYLDFSLLKLKNKWYIIDIY